MDIAGGIYHRSFAHNSFFVAMKEARNKKGMGVYYTYVLLTEI